MRSTLGFFLALGIAIPYWLLRWLANRTRGSYSFDATGAYDGRFTGPAYAEQGVVSSQNFSITLDILSPPPEHQELFFHWLNFVVDAPPTSGVYTVIAGERGEGSVRQRTVVAWIDGRSRPVWQGVDGTLRIDAASYGGRLTGEFSLRLVPPPSLRMVVPNSPPEEYFAQSVHLTGRFETRPRGVARLVSLVRRLRRR
jgi:hypothetical protein